MCCEKAGDARAAFSTQCFAKPEAIPLLLFLGCFLVLRFDAKFTVGSIAVRPGDLYLFFVASIVAGTVMSNSGIFPLRVTAIGVFSYLFMLGFAALSMLWSYDLSNNLVQLIEWMSMGLVFFSVPAMLRDTDSIERILRFSLYTLLILEGTRLMAMLVEYAAAGDYVRIRYSGYLSAAGFLLVTAAVFSETPVKSKSALYGFGLFFGAMVVLSLTRKIWIGTALALMLQIMAARSIRNVGRVFLILAVLIACLSVASVVSPFFREKIAGRKIPLINTEISSQSKGIGGRYAAYRTMVEVVRDHPLGIGLGGYHKMFRDRYTDTFMSFNPGRSPIGAHSGLIYDVAELGLIGVLPFLFLLGRPMKLIFLPPPIRAHTALFWLSLWTLGLWAVAVAKYLLEASSFERRFSVFFALGLAEFIFWAWRRHAGREPGA